MSDTVHAGALLFCLSSCHPLHTRCVFSSLNTQWHRETDVGSDMYVATQHTFWELPKTVQVVKGGLVFDPALQVWVRPKGHDGTPAPPLCFAGDEGIVASIMAERRGAAPRLPSSPVPGLGTSPAAPGSAGKAIALTPNCFAFLKNNKWAPEAPPSTQSPQFWVVRVVGVGPGPPAAGSALARVQWFQETEVGSGLYRQTPRMVSELVKSLRPLQAVPDAAAKAFRVVGPFDDSYRFLEPRGQR